LNFRNQRFKLGVVNSIASKISAVALQLIAVPIAIKACGAEAYSLYLGLVAASMLPSVFLMRMGPAFIAKISSTYETGDLPKLAVLLRGSLLITIANAFLAGVAATLALNYLPLNIIFGKSPLAQDVVHYITILSLISIGGALFSTIEAFQAGLHQTHVLAIRATVSNIVAALSLVFVLPAAPNVLTLILTIQAIPFAFRLINAVFFITSERRMFYSDISTKGALKGIFSDAISFTLVAGVSNYAGYQLPLLLVSTMLAGPMVGVITISIDVILQLIRGLGVILGPSVPALAGAHRAHDRKSVRRLILTIFISGNVLAGTVAVTSLAAVSLFHASIDLPRDVLMLLVSSASAFYWMLTLETISASSIYAIGSEPSISRTYISQALRCFTSSLVVFSAISFGGQNLTLALMAAATLVCSVIPNVSRLLSILGQNNSNEK